VIRKNQISLQNKNKKLTTNCRYLSDKLNLSLKSMTM